MLEILAKPLTTVTFLLIINSVRILLYLLGIRVVFTSESEVVRLLNWPEKMDSPRILEQCDNVCAHYCMSWEDIYIAPPHRYSIHDHDCIGNPSVP